MKRILIAILMILLGGLPANGQANNPNSVVNSAHNLSVSGTGTVKAAGEQEVCIFCHTPHNATPVQPLWNRAMPVSAYKPYTSNSLKALPGQPTGASKLCLSCHDGTIALGSVKSRGQPIQMAGGIMTLPPGASNLGTDLSDDHPISFAYDNTLAVKNLKLKSPAGLPPTVKLDANKELQCTTCHDAHNNRFGSFLVMSNQGSALCNTCHTMGQTEVTAHAPCGNCHKTHTAPSGPYLLTQQKVGGTCLACHSGTPAASGPGAGANQGLNIATVLGGTFRHDTQSAVNLANHIPDNVDCKDCHESHTMTLAGSTTAPAIQGTMGKVDGVSVAGGTVTAVQYEYEVCFKCHGDKTASVTHIGRVIVQYNLRLKFAPSAVSFHPVAAKGTNQNVPSLRPGYTTQSMIYCTDCHGSDSSKKAGGAGPNGPHGSNYAGLLLAPYSTVDYTSYTTTAYALCFRCHDNTKVVADSGPFPKHKTHIQDKQTPCSVCHDSHGVASVQGTPMNNFALINFDTSVVFPDEVTNRIQFVHTGNQQGRCFLKCHGVNHSGTSY